MKGTLTIEPSVEGRTGAPNIRANRAGEPAGTIEDGLNIGRQLVIGLAMVLFLTALTGLIYPLVVTGIAQVVFPAQANGSIIANQQGRPIGSSLIGQVFTDAKYF